MIHNLFHLSPVVRPLWKEVATFVGFAVPMPALELYLEDSELSSFSLGMNWSHADRTISLGIAVYPSLHVVPPTLTHTLILPDFREERVTNLDDRPSAQWIEWVLQAPSTTQRIPAVDGPSEAPIADTLQALSLINSLKKVLRRPRTVV